MTGPWTSWSAATRTRVALGLAAVLAALTGIVFAPVVESPADAVRTGTVSRTKTVERVAYAADGTATQVAGYDVKLDVSETTNLRGRQELTVRWTGAHPSGGLVNDVNSGAGINTEYPFVLLQCRGVDNPGKGQEQVRPETCWTQTAQERFTRDNSTGWPAWRSDAFATAGQRARTVSAPDPRPSECGRVALAERWLPFVALSGRTYAGGPVPLGGCVGMAPESDEVGDGSIPSNSTFAMTKGDGSGHAEFAVWTASENASLGCSASVACSLVAIPVVGISCDPYGTRLPVASRPSPADAATADAQCSKADTYTAGQLRSDAKLTNLATSGALWWAPSNWRNRITVPLSFAASDSVCKVVGGGKPQPVYGSVLLNELTASWQPKFCTDKGLFPVVHVQSSESAARNLLSVGNVDAALGSRPLDAPSRPTVQAPVAIGGFGVVFKIDAADGSEYPSLKINGRLLAKLLSQSYPALDFVKSDYAALSGNPMNLTMDPEFRALNPGVKIDAANATAATIQVLSTDSDLVWAVTRYLDADPEARAFLDGTPDPWGMKVNPSYQDIDLPVDAWPQKDTWLAPDWYDDSDRNYCYAYSPAPVLGLVANPTANISTIALNVQYAISAVNMACAATDRSDVGRLGLKKYGKQLVGSRFVIGLSTLSAASRYNLRTAALQTTSTVPSGSRFTDAGGRTFVAPDKAGLTSAAALLKPDEEAGTWTFDYAGLRTAAGSAAYPGLVPVYADVPTQGVEHETAVKVSRFLCYAATRGQVAGSANGQLPDGYLPLTDANGLGQLQAYTVRAARLVKAQNGQLPGLTGEAGTCSTAADPVATTPVPKPAADPAGAAPIGGGPAPAAAPGAVGSPQAAPATEVTVPLELVKTRRDYSPLGNAGLLLALFLVLAAAFAGLVLRLYPERHALVAAARTTVRTAGRGAGKRVSR
ncbi:hypothetical protein [Marmoricola sp. RAF53]|uniref:hypothetical protein n=1 Tax=Marmoricola sp. RAF53 TaxID=3233059 RepID=UPI003F966503